MATLHINGFYAKCSKVTGRHPPESYLVASKGHETVKIFYADANERITQNRGFDGRTNGYYPDKQHSSVTYLDANNLYGTAMFEQLRIGNFCFVSERDISDRDISEFDVMTIPADGPAGYI